MGFRRMTRHLFAQNRHIWGPATSVAVLLAVGTAFPRTLAAQESADNAFDIDRAFVVDHTIFVPFEVKEMIPLRQALDDGRIDKTTQLLILDRGTRQLALVTGQMAYHHIAQGELDGEPWMVSF